VVLSRKGAKSQTQGRKLRSPGTEPRTSVDRTGKPRTDLEEQLEKYIPALAEAREQLAESLEQQTATSEVLRIVGSSRGELQPVFQAILANATRICAASFGVLFRSAGDALEATAMLGVPRAFAEYLRAGPVFPGPETGLGRAARAKQVVHLVDVQALRGDAERDPYYAKATELSGARTILFVPMLKEHEFIGIIAIFRQEVRQFTNRQVELVTNFAHQAVIAIENARLLNELRQRTDDLSEALEQQTATSEVLHVISSSPGELQSVFQAMLENSTRLCEASYGTLWLSEGEAFRAVSLHGPIPAAYREQLSGTLFHLSPEVPLARAAQSRHPVQAADLRASRAYLEGDALVVAAVDVAGIRTVVNVPMLHENETLGVIAIYRQEVRPFTDKQIELVQNFAKQAVIAIENTRLLNELRESLQQQTATSEVLQVISSSPGELEPVFQAMLENATRICEASFGNLLLYDGNAFRHVALHNAPQPWAAEQQRDPVPPRRSARVLYRVADTKQVVHVADIAAENPDEPIAKVAGARTLLIVPSSKRPS
jgi:GAF domain-containing protein